MEEFIQLAQIEQTVKASISAGSYSYADRYTFVHLSIYTFYTPGKPMCLLMRILQHQQIPIKTT